MKAKFKLDDTERIVKIGDAKAHENTTLSNRVLSCVWKDIRDLAYILKCTVLHKILPQTLYIITEATVI